MRIATGEETESLPGLGIASLVAANKYNRLRAMKFEDLLQSEPYRWPRKGDLPLKAAKRSKSAGPLATDAVSRTVFIMDGFMLSGEELADVGLREPLRRHELVFPMLYCYRHAIETGLKWIVGQYGRQVGVTRPDLNHTHNLVDLWGDCLKIYEACGTKADNEANSAVGRAVKQFHNWDKAGIRFRYATSKHGGTVKFQYDHIDIENLKDVMAGIHNFFSGSDGWLNDIVNA